MVTRQHADELHVDLDLARRLVDAQHPQWAGLPVRPGPESGTVNVVFRLGDELAVRLPRQAASATEVEREHRWLPRLAPRLPVATPELVALGGPAPDYPSHWSVQRWIAGAVPAPGRLGTPVELAHDLAAFVSALRRVDVDGAPPSSRGGSLAPRDASFRDRVVQLADDVDVTAVLRAWEESLAAPSWPGPSVWFHGDLLAPNLLLRDGRLAAVLDFAAAGAGDPACDLMPAWSVLPAEGRSAFLAAVGADEATRLRGRGWSLSQAVFAWPYYRDTNAELVATARHAIAEIVAEVSL